MTLKNLISPKSIAVIGASEDVSKPGGNLVRNILSKGYAGQLYLVNPKGQVIQGITAYPSVKDLPITPELALIAVPSVFVRQTLLDLVEKGTPTVIVLSAGFGEVSPEGKIEEQKLADIARDNGILLLGPNCLGAASYEHASMFAGLMPDFVQGGIDFISGSGATVVYLAEQSVKRGLTFSSFLSVGNSVQTGVEDLLALFEQEFDGDSSQIKIVYLEAINKPQLLLQSARSLNRKGCYLAGIKSGTTQAGSRAAASHTGAMATNDTAVQALFDKAGIIRTQSRIELIDVANALVCAKGKLDGKRIGIITDAGGPGVVLADELNRLGFEVPPFKETTRAQLAKVLLPGSGMANPVDCLPARTGPLVAKIFEIIHANEVENIDYLLVIIGDSRLSDNWEIYQEVIKAMDTGPIPVFPSFCSVISSHDALEKYKQAGKCFFEDEVAMARALGRVVNRPQLTEPVTSMVGFDHHRIAALLAGQSGALSAKITRQVLEAAGLGFPGQLELTERAELNGVSFKFPWVMKVMGPLHKSDVGGVRVGIQSLDEAQKTWDDLLRIKDASGCMIQQMVSGSEVIMGVNREPGYGHLLAFGLGGIYTEALKDVNFTLAPLSNEEAEKMIRSLRAFALIKGMRGEPGMDIELLKEWLIRISLLVTGFPQIKEMDLNPVKGIGKNLFVVDARIIVD